MIFEILFALSKSCISIAFMLDLDSVRDEM